MNPSESRVRVLIVDDSALMRKLLADLLRTAPEVEVVGSARDGDEAVRLTAELRPHVVTLDVEMPGRSGLDVLPEILSAHETSVLMVSSFTQEGADVTLAALERGAADFFPKPDRHQLARMREGRDQFVAKVLEVAQYRPRRRRSEAHAPTPAPTPPPRPQPAEPAEPKASGGAAASFRCVVIGISTGGPQALGAVLPLIAPPVPPVLVVQHMPAQFTAVFAQRLNRSCQVPVKEAAEGDRVVPNQILVAPGGRHMGLAGLPPKARVTLSDDPPMTGHKPSVDYLFKSAARVFQAGAVGFIMTGMGRDGVEGCHKILAAGGMTYGQDEATSSVYGMNKVAFLEGAVLGQFSLDQLPALIRKASAAR
ncbi:MAG: chemotaxis response regulator protein-glutamate methylesterase [Isosphaeraceae bacterium]